MEYQKRLEQTRKEVQEGDSEELRRRGDAALAAYEARQQEARAELRKRLEDKERRRNERRRQSGAALAELLKRTNQLVHQHRLALDAQYRCKVYKDAYGSLVRPGWMRELAHFIKNVVIPQLQPWIHAFEEARNGYISGDLK